MSQSAKGGAVLPVQAVGLHGWDGDEWLQLLLSSGGALSVDLLSVNGTTQTADDWTLRFQALNDDTVQGLLRSIGDAGAGPSNTTGETVLQKLERAARALDTIGANAGALRTLGDAGAGATDVTGETVLAKLDRVAASADTVGAAAGLLRTLGDAGAGATDASGNTVLRLLTQILSALGGTTNQHYEVLGPLTAPAGGGWLGTTSFSQDVENALVLCRTSDIDIRLSDLVPTLQGNIPVFRNSNYVHPTQTRDIDVRLLGGVAGTAATVYVIGYYN